MGFGHRMAFWNKILKKEKREAEKKEVHKETPQETGATIEEKKSERGAGYETGVLRAPHVTEKTSNAAKENKYVFSIAPDANKFTVARVVEKKYGVEVTGVNMVRLPSKKRIRGKQIGWKAGLKKAIVKVKQGQTIEIQ